MASEQIGCFVRNLPGTGVWRCRLWVLGRLFETYLHDRSEAPHFLELCEEYDRWPEGWRQILQQTPAAS